ncbi:MAG TPA: epoxyqueuosine reductase QueH [bacterium]|nr:epoxyqueuosine reductase QueH [bacterium]
MRILLHACCGPCLVAPARALAAEGREILAFWYNPNVQPYREYRKRLAAFKEVISRDGWPAEVDDRYDVDFFLREVAVRREGRCPRCYNERLSRAAARAAARGCDAFTTTLLISRHQDHEAVLDAGARAGAEAGVAFMGRDFRPLDDESHRLAREMGLYLQGYCGCIYSEEERYRKPEDVDSSEVRFGG